jgi:hypothetical protein
VIASVADVEIVVSVKGTAVGFPDHALQRRTAVTGVAFLASADDSLDFANLNLHVLSQTFSKMVSLEAKP